jgi:hypothetical protein
MTLNADRARKEILRTGEDFLKIQSVLISRLTLSLSLVLSLTLKKAESSRSKSVNKESARTLRSVRARQRCLLACREMKTRSLKWRKRLLLLNTHSNPRLARLKLLSR